MAHEAVQLKAKLRQDLTTAMKAKDAMVVSTLRMALSAVQTEEVAGKQARQLSDDEVLRVLVKEAKKRAESAEAFDGAGRDELAVKERAEAAVLQGYLPARLSDEEVSELADEAVAQVESETGSAPGMRQMGQVMKVAGSAAAGRADGSRLSAAVKARLGAERPHQFPGPGTDGGGRPGWPFPGKPGSTGSPGVG